MVTETRINMAAVAFLVLCVIGGGFAVYQAEHPDMPVIKQTAERMLKEAAKLKEQRELASLIR